MPVPPSMSRSRSPRRPTPAGQYVWFRAGWGQVLSASTATPLLSVARLAGDRTQPSGAATDGNSRGTTRMSRCGTARAAAATSCAHVRRLGAVPGPDAVPWLGAVPGPGAVAGPGGQDSHWLRDAFGTIAYGFFPLREMPAHVADGLIHSADERIRVDDLELGLECFRHVARTVCGG